MSTFIKYFAEGKQSIEKAERDDMISTWRNLLNEVII
jgi:hypothetical protein